MLATMDKRKCRRKRGIYTYAHTYDQLAVTSLYEGPRALVTFTTERNHRAIHRDLIPTCNPKVLPENNNVSQSISLACVISFFSCR